MSLRIWMKRVRRRLSGGAQTEPEMYRIGLFEELAALAGRERFRDKRILEIGPKDGRDSRRLASLGPAELVLIDLPEKREKIDQWIGQVACPHRYLEANFMYMPWSELQGLGPFDLAWCTGVLYHNAEQLRMLRKLYRLLNEGGWLVLESATLRLARKLREGRFVEIHYPRTYRDTGTITHLPTAGAIRAWLAMAGFGEIHDSHCFAAHNRDLIGQRYACLCRKTGTDQGDVYYANSGLNPAYRLGDSV